MKALVIFLPTDDNINIEKLSLKIGDYLINGLQTESQIVAFSGEEVAQLLIKSKIEAESKVESLTDPIFTVIETILRELPDSDNLVNFNITKSTIWVSDLVFRYLGNKDFHNYMVENRPYIKDFLYDKRVIRNTRNNEKYIRLREILRSALESIHFFD